MIKKCPACDSKMVVRFGKYGNFYGCTAYPQCEYTENMSGNRYKNKYENHSGEWYEDLMWHQNY